MDAKQHLMERQMVGRSARVPSLISLLAGPLCVAMAAMAGPTEAWAQAVQPGVSSSRQVGDPSVPVANEPGRAGAASDERSMEPDRVMAERDRESVGALPEPGSRSIARVPAAAAFGSVRQSERARAAMGEVIHRERRVLLAESFSPQGERRAVGGGSSQSTDAAAFGDWDPFVGSERTDGSGAVQRDSLGRLMQRREDRLAAKEAEHARQFERELMQAEMRDRREMRQHEALMAESSRRHESTEREADRRFQADQQQAVRRYQSDEAGKQHERILQLDELAWRREQCRLRYKRAADQESRWQEHQNDLEIARANQSHEFRMRVIGRNSN